MACTLFPFEWCAACGGLELFDEVVRGAEAGAGCNLLDVEVAFKQKLLYLRDAVGENGLAERLPEAGGTCLVEPRTRFTERLRDLFRAEWAV